MNKLIILPLLCFLCISCADVEPEEEEPVEPVEKPTQTVAPTPLPVKETDPTAAFLTPKQDRELPSAEQLADGADSSIGAGSPGTIPLSTQPSTTITPPIGETPPTTASTPNLEDDLAPAE